jgi:hypothetical protein
VYGETELDLDPPKIIVEAKDHDIVSGFGGSGPNSASDGHSGKPLGRDMTKIGTNAVSAIIDCTVQLPLSVRQTGLHLIARNVFFG